MKKILYSLTIFISLFIFTQNVEASCKYVGPLEKHKISIEFTEKSKYKVCYPFPGKCHNDYSGFQEFEWEYNDTKYNFMFNKKELSYEDYSSCTSEDKLYLCKQQGGSNTYMIQKEECDNNYTESKVLNVKQDIKEEVIFECTKEKQKFGNSVLIDIKLTHSKQGDTDKYKYCAKQFGSDDYNCKAIDEENSILINEINIGIEELQKNAIIEKLNTSKCEEIQIRVEDEDTPNYWSISTFTVNTTTESNVSISAYDFKSNIENLKTPLEVLLSKKGKNLSDYSINLDGKEVSLASEEIGYGNGICSANYCNEPDYQTKQAIKNVKAYCNNVKRYEPTKSGDSYAKRKEECTSFEELYSNLVKDGIISNLSEEGCGFISDDLKHELKKILNVIKIAGPVLAVVLGMLDFAKVVMSGDPDKGTKEAWKRFQIRLLAAALLFLIPVLLEIPLNQFNQSSDNPFCGVDE